MKPLKNSWLRASVMLLLVTGIFLTLNAMKKASPVATHDLVSWYYIAGEPTNPLSYSSTPMHACFGDEDVICRIEALADGDYPFLDEPEIKNIEEALASIKDGEAEINETVRSFRGR